MLLVCFLGEALKARDFKTHVTLSLLRHLWTRRVVFFSDTLQVFHVSHTFRHSSYQSVCDKPRNTSSNNTMEETDISEMSSSSAASHNEQV